MDPYAVLGVPRDADATRIRAAYLALMQRHHPDRCAGDAHASEERTKEINAAFAVLGDPRKRAAHDASRSVPPGGAPARAPVRQSAKAVARRLASRRSRMIASGGAAAAALLVMVAAVVVSRASPPRFSLVRFEAAEAAEGAARPPAEGGVAAPAYIMLPWPDLAPRPEPVRSEGLELTFEGRAAEGEARVTIRDARGESVVVKLPKGVELAGARYGVGRLDPESRAASVVVAFRIRGEACCSQIRVVDRADGAWKVLDLGSRPGRPLEVFPSELDGDGVREFVLPDPRFASMFGPSEEALFPPQVLQVRAGRVVDVSASGRFRSTFRQEMEAARPICALGSNSACAAFVADAARAGRLQWAWAVMLTSYDPEADWPLPAGCAVEAALGKCPPGQVRRFSGFPVALEDFLRRTGYAREAPLGLGETAAPLTPPASRDAEPERRARPGSPG